jgi:hypothetical protein
MEPWELERRLHLVTWEDFFKGDQFNIHNWHQLTRIAKTLFPKKKYPELNISQARLHPVQPVYPGLYSIGVSCSGRKSLTYYIYEGGKHEALAITLANLLQGPTYRFICDPDARTLVYSPISGSDLKPLDLSFFQQDGLERQGCLESYARALALAKFLPVGSLRDNPIGVSMTPEGEVLITNFEFAFTRFQGFPFEQKVLAACPDLRAKEKSIEKIMSTKQRLNSGLISELTDYVSSSEDRSF